MYSVWYRDKAGSAACFTTSLPTRVVADNIARSLAEVMGLPLSYIAKDLLSGDVPADVLVWAERD